MDIKETTVSLLQGLKDPQNRLVWQEFVNIYRPRIVRYATHSFGLSAADAEDATQETLNVFFEAYLKGSYDREKGRLRKWLFGIATKQIKNYIRKKSRGPKIRSSDPTADSSPLPHIPDDSELERQWEEEWRRAVFKQCFERVRRHLDQKTIDAYHKFVHEGRPAEEVAAELDMSPNAVYLAKRRVLERIRKILPEMDDLPPSLQGLSKGGEVKGGK